MVEVTEAAGGTDRRVLRGLRNRAAVAQAFLDLVTEGDLAPTAQKVAERAGVSLRSVFHHFDDMEQLFAAAADLHVSRYIDLVRALPADGPLPARIDAFVAERAALAERILPVYRASLLVAHRSPTVSERLARGDERLRTEIERTFTPELAGAPWRLDAVDAVASLDGWLRLRVRQRLASQEAAAVLTAALHSLLSSPRPGGGHGPGDEEEGSRR